MSHVSVITGNSTAFFFIGEEGFVVQLKAPSKSINDCARKLLTEGVFNIILCNEKQCEENNV